MNQEEKEKNSRRRFLALGMFGDVGLEKLHAKTTPGSDETIPMLTADGKLVEINKALLDNVKREKATNHDILNWSEPLKHSKLP